MIAICLVIALGFLTTIFLENSEIEEQIKANKKSILKELFLNEKIKLANELRLAEESKYFEEKTQAMEIEFTQESLPQEERKIEKEISIFNYEDEKEVEPIVKKTIETKPKLVIIIDDVTTSSQIRKIKNIPYPVTMAFLPPTPRHKHSATIAKDISVYMIHLPLEARGRKYEELNTLHVGDGIDTIDNRIKKLKKLYPSAKYINNHTGSKFTQDDRSMDKLLKVLKKYKYIFVDSRTTGKTVTKRYATKHNIQYFSRNIFLDNKRDKIYIKNQLKKAVNIARKEGFAIAIGHPHNITLKTLAQSKYMLDGLDIVLINKL